MAGHLLRAKLAPVSNYTNFLERPGNDKGAREMLNYKSAPQSVNDISSGKPVTGSNSPVAAPGKPARRLTTRIKAVALWCWDGYVQAVCHTVYVDEQGHAYSTWVF